MARSRKAEAARRGTNCARLDALTDADIERMAAADPNDPATTAAEWAAAMVGFPPHKTPVTIKFDVDVVAWFKARGRAEAAQVRRSAKPNGACS